MQLRTLLGAVWTSPEAEVCKVQAACMLSELLRQVLELVRGHVCGTQRLHFKLQVRGKAQGLHCKRGEA